MVLERTNTDGIETWRERFVEDCIDDGAGHTQWFAYWEVIGGTRRPFNEPIARTY